MNLSNRCPRAAGNRARPCGTLSQMRCIHIIYIHTCIIEVHIYIYICKHIYIYIYILHIILLLLLTFIDIDYCSLQARPCNTLNQFHGLIHNFQLLTLLSKAHGHLSRARLILYLIIILILLILLFFVF